MINEIDNSKLIFHFFIKDQTIKFQYIFVLILDLNKRFISMRNNFYISKICNKIEGTTKFQNLDIEGQKKLRKKSVLQTFKTEFF